jgi:hypothetical protein
LLAGAWFSGAGPTRWSAPPLGGRAVIARSEPPHGAAHEDEAWRRRLSLLAGEAEARLALARRTEDLLASRGAARARVGGAAQPDVMTEALLAAEAAAQTLLQKGDRFAHNLNMPREAAREYRRVERLYPDTAGARSAARRLSSLPDGA